MRGYLVSVLGLLLGLTAAWAGSGDGAAPAPSGASAQPGTTRAALNLDEATKKLTEATGATWRIPKGKRAPGLGAELWVEISSWHGVAVPYVKPQVFSNGQGRYRVGWVKKDPLRDSYWYAWFEFDQTALVVAGQTGSPSLLTVPDITQAPGWDDTHARNPAIQPANAGRSPQGEGAQPATGAADRQLEPLWDAMKDANAATALEAVKTLESKGSQAVAFLRKKLSPISELDAAGVQRLIDQLDAPEYAVRQRATDELALHGMCIADPLVNAQKAPKSLEARVRLNALVKDAYRPVPATPAASRWLRAVRVLERIGTPEARDLLGELAKGAAGARGTQQAREAINRLGGGAKTASLAWWLARAEEEVETTGFQEHYFGQISAVLADAGLIDAAAAMERRSKADLEARYHLAAAYARAGRQKEAQEVAYSVHNPDGVAETRCRIGIALAATGRVEPVVPPQSSADWVAATVDHAFSAEEAGTWKVRKSLALSAEARIHAAIAVAHAAAGRKELYRKHIDLAQGLTDKIDVDINASWAASLSSDSKASEAPGVDIFGAINKTSAIEAVALARARVGDYDGARAAVNRMQAGRSRDARTRILAEDLSDRGVLKEALATAEGIEEKTHRDLALLSVVGGFLRTKDRAGAQGAADKLRTDAYQAAARLALRDEPGDQQDYQAVARYDVTVCRLARIQAQTPGRNPVAILRWIQALPRSDQRYYALLGVAGDILAAQGPAVPPAPSASSRPAVQDAAPPATQPATDGAGPQVAPVTAEAIAERIRALGSALYKEREQAQQWLIDLGDQAADALREAAKGEGESAVRAKAALVAIGRRKLAKFFVGMPVRMPPGLPDDSGATGRLAWIEALGALSDLQTTGMLLEYLEDNGAVREAAAEALRKMSGQTFADDPKQWRTSATSGL